MSDRHLTHFIAVRKIPSLSAGVRRILKGLSQVASGDGHRTVADSVPPLSDPESRHLAGSNLKPTGPPPSLGDKTW